jgi:hypothetical protein
VSKPAPHTPQELAAVANPEHLEILKQGAEAWNKWRQENAKITPDLEDINIVKARAGDSDFVGTYVDSYAEVFERLLSDLKAGA